MATLLEKIKGLYVKDKHSLAYMAYDIFETFHCPSNMNIIDYINEFEWLYNQIEQNDMELLTGVLVYWILKNAYISNEKWQLAQAMLKCLSHGNVKKQLKPIW